jgi:hypothetical protein
MPVKIRRLIHRPVIVDKTLSDGIFPSHMLFNKEIIEMTEERHDGLGRGLDRRGFIQLCAATGSGLVFYGGQNAFGAAPVGGLVLKPEALSGKLKEDGLYSRFCPFEPVFGPGQNADECGRSEPLAVRARGRLG